jgi:hypothetical protein
MASFSKRFAGALRLDPATYEEVEADAGALGQAMAVVLIANLAVGIGLGARQGAQGLIGITLASLVTWLIWAAVIWFVGTKILPTPTTSSSIGELLRTTGFALAPGVFRVFSAVPVFGYLIAFIVDVWILAAVVVAVRQALDYTSTWRAVAVCLTGWLLYVFVGFLLVPLTGMPV